MKKIVLLFVVFSLNFLTAEDSSYKFIDLNPPNSVFSMATDMNEKGQVVGIYITEDDRRIQREGFRLTGDLYKPFIYSVFLWGKEQGFQLLGKTVTYPKINNLGHVIGSKYRKLSSFWGDKGILEAYIWRPETGEELLGRLPGKKLKNASAYPQSINDHDQVLVTDVVDNLDDLVWLIEPDINSTKTWIWQEGVYKKVSDLENAKHLSNEQIIAGSVTVPYGWFGKREIATLYDLSNDLLLPGPLADEKISAKFLMGNAQGDFLGRVVSLDKRKIGSFLWNNDRNIENLPEHFIATWINNKREVVGYYHGNLFLYDGKDLKEIKKLLDQTLIDEKYETVKINDNGQIAGSFLCEKVIKDPDSIDNIDYHAFFIEPQNPQQ